MKDKKYNEYLSKYFKLDPTSPSGLRWIARYGRGSKIKIGDVVGSLDKKDGYWRIHALGGFYKAHKVVWAMHNNFENQEDFSIDHKDHNRSNNSIDNLRLVPRLLNCRNRSMNKNNSTGVLGVSYSERNQPSGLFFSKYNAMVAVETGKKQSKSFSIQKYGKKLAFEMAVNWRKSSIEKLKARGFGYHENHGS